MKFNVELNSKVGLAVNIQVSQKALKALITMGVGLGSLSWLVQIAHALGWM